MAVKFSSVNQCPQQETSASRTLIAPLRMTAASVAPNDCSPPMQAPGLTSGCVRIFTMFGTADNLPTGRLRLICCTLILLCPAWGETRSVINTALLEVDGFSEMGAQINLATHLRTELLRRWSPRVQTAYKMPPVQEIPEIVKFVNSITY